jgi:hypothetical protein
MALEAKPDCLLLDDSNLFMERIYYIQRQRLLLCCTIGVFSNNKKERNAREQVILSKGWIRSRDWRKEKGEGEESMKVNGEK